VAAAAVEQGRKRVQEGTVLLVVLMVVKRQKRDHLLYTVCALSIITTAQLCLSLLQWLTQELLRCVHRHYCSVST
jgi:hypothetical protein